MASFDLPLGKPPAADTDAGKTTGFLPAELLADNVFWFCRLRWIVIALLCVAEGMAASAGGFLERYGVYLSSRWPVVCAAVLAVTNILFLLDGRRLRRLPDPRAANTNLVLQSVSDLLVLTVVVHFVGSVETFAPFAYLFHVVLACIFFPSKPSLGITLLSCLLYSACVAVEYLGLFPAGGLFARLPVRAGFQAQATPLVLHVSSAMAVWLLVWYLVSHLSAAVRRRDRDLVEANERLIRVENEKAMHMLRTTHELKAPFAAIQSNVQLLQKGYCGELSDEVAEVLDRIGTRCLKLSTQIMEMLQLADLRSLPAADSQREKIRLDRLLHSVADGFRVPASARRIEIEERIRPATTTGVMGHLHMMLSNVTSNAVVYSREGGRVTVTCEPQATGEVVVTVEDHGIGIPERSLPHIFQEYYRSSEAAQYNKLSTGLGLAIVRHIAESHDIAVHVDSTEGEGTVFRLTFPAPDEEEVLPCPES